MNKLCQHILRPFAKPEQMVYIIVWAAVFLMPVIENLFEWLSARNTDMRWEEVLEDWYSVLPFLLLFVFHDKLLTPFLFKRRRVWLYVILSLIFSLLFILLTTSFQNVPQRKHKGTPDFVMKQEPPKRPDGHPFPSSRPPRTHRPTTFFLMPMPVLGRMVMALLMLCFNIAVKLFFKSLRDKEAMKELERQNLQSELEYLKYQINPHFFMNTLNNIHALVDIDSEKAKQCIVELSRLMRYLLYESDKRTILLEKEIQFLQHYVELMSIRYPKSVCITLSLPTEVEDLQVPPLLFISFVENAFKHGVSYQKASYISVTLTLETNHILFHCVNSNYGKKENQHHGIGLENIRKRLQLLFAERYSLLIKQTDEYFDVTLSIPNGK